MKTRREILQGLIVSIGGASALAACNGAATVFATKSGSVGRFYTANEMALVSRISELIIPRTETPGALDANVPGYLDGLMADWANEETQQVHRNALQMLQSQLGDRVNGDFLDVTEAVAESALTELDAAAFEGDESLRGYRTLKSYVSQAYFATEDGAIDELKWVAVPGRWDPAVEIPA
ncbi:MAG: hypothetical protein COA96_08375 [SAR86 cluster bacterium]|uniref:Gluconate 2-dehydrogenase subunit 3 family protein n=1 Tax=SAR86 cluster bacterium TaxID=2030880 RepID=A0A2A5B1N7_9GAMM|nr:MAG: hypothetical protein COA96_08375 [SAR86 cluster bacterium]